MHVSINKVERVVFLDQANLPDDPDQLEELDDLVVSLASQEMGEEQILCSNWVRVAGGGYECQFTDTELVE